MNTKVRKEIYAAVTGQSKVVDLAFTSGKTPFVSSGMIERSEFDQVLIRTGKEQENEQV